MYINNLPSVAAGIRTRDLLIHNHSATMPYPKITNNVRAAYSQPAWELTEK